MFCSPSKETVPHHADAFKKRRPGNSLKRFGSKLQRVGGKEFRPGTKGKKLAISLGIKGFLQKKSGCIYGKKSMGQLKNI